MNPQNGYDIEDITVGMSAEIAKTITDAGAVSNLNDDVVQLMFGAAPN